MSKEQTPITAEEFLERIGHDKDVICESMFDKPYLQSSVSDLMEQYAQAKVLEALEREFMILNERSGTGAEKEYYETEVKPKYE